MALSMPAQHQHHLNGMLRACTTTPASRQRHSPCLHNTTSITSMALSMPAQQHQHHLNGTLYACTTTPASPQWHAPCLHNTSITSMARSMPHNNTSITSMARSMPHNNTSMAEGIRWAASTWLTEHSTAVCYGRGTPFRFSCSTHLDLIFSLQQNGIPCERSHIHFAAEWNPQ